MKFKNFLPAIALLLTVAASFAFRPVVSKSAKFITCDKVFTYDGGGVNDPLNYTLTTSDPASFCLGTVQLCALCLKNSLVYTHDEAIAAGHSNWTNKPKVINDGTGGNTLDDDIRSALNQIGTPVNPFHGTNADIYLKP